MKKTIAFFATACGALLGQGAYAADNGFYLGGAVGQSSTDLSTSAVGAATGLFDDSGTGFKVMAGLRPLDWLGVEASYVDLGDVTQMQALSGVSDLRFSQSAVDAFGVLFADVAMVDLFAKAGLAQWKADGVANTFLGPVEMDDDGTDFAWALGAQARFLSFALRLEYERFETEAFDGLMEKPEMISLGFTWTFF